MTKNTICLNKSMLLIKLFKIYSLEDRVLELKYTILIQANNTKPKPELTEKPPVLTELSDSELVWLIDTDDTEDDIGLLNLLNSTLGGTRTVSMA